jgi:hypothetical protein
MAALAALLFSPAVLRAQVTPTDDDHWDLLGDDNIPPETVNRIVHGQTQFHAISNLNGPGPTFSDRDHVLVRVEAGRSYEARAFGTSREGVGGTRLLDGLRVVIGSSPVAVGTYADHVWTVRWTPSATGVQYLLPETALLTHGWYTLDFVETTVFVPRWNNSASQLTILLLQNAGDADITGTIRFLGAAGNLVHSQPFNMPYGGGVVINTSTIPPLQGLSGVAQIAHNGGYGAVLGKAVAVEPATGFTFDTPVSVLPR